ncbi:MULTISPECIES: GNAT family N-acetyltransferase [Actinoalloteichus]|uniref:Acetyltransferase n=1 Tax=Actinoalloteichus fjordicus TaxID=1612552 RepID=A0AAC9LHS0_9PSEU|nr:MULTISPECIES: GNAT family N-acetyltransferase [Actinoalloteichus]APU17109.1 putative acetyltransferase [Actinoalloteichus fjordicus]APU23191.1 putative acetyltransferase [Actinoalloteichus sp. GBA129-24]
MNSQESAAEPDLVVRDAPERRRYEARLGSELAGFIDYDVDGTVLALLHAEVAEEFGGRGIGGRMVRQTLDDVRGRGLRIRPACSFVANWVARHPDYADLVDRQDRA